MLLAIFLCGLPLRADITATVTIKGTPLSKDETFVAQSFGCGESPVRHTENWKIGPKSELADVVVWIEDAKPAPPDKPLPPAPQVIIKQTGCRYDPHVVAVTAGAPLRIINGDPTLHNIRAKVVTDPRQPPGTDVFNFGQSYQGQRDDRSFDNEGIYILRCDVHSWMQSWVRVLPTPFFGVTGADGMAHLWNAGLADGTYKIAAWHPRFVKPLEQTITVKAGIATAAFQFDASQSF